MQEWEGRRDDTTLVGGPGLLDAQNVSLRFRGEVRRRPGLADRIDETGALVTDYQDRQNAKYLAFATTGGALTTVALADKTEATLKSALSTAYRGCFAKSNQRLYYANDFDPMQVVERGDASAQDAGIAAPASAMTAPTSTGTGLVEAGTRRMRYRYYNSQSGYVSNPSDSVAVTTTATGATLLVSIGTGSTNVIRSTDAKVDQVIIEMTPNSDSTYYQVAAVNQTLSSTTISYDESQLVALDAIASKFGDFGHEKPPAFALLAEHRGRLFGWGATVRTVTGVSLTLSGTSVTVTGETFSTLWAGRLLQVGTGATYRISASTTSTITLSTAYSGSTTTGATITVFSAKPDLLSWSRATLPESWKPSEWARQVLQNQTDEPSGMMSHHNALYLFGQRTMRILDYDKDPALGDLEQVPAEMGLWNQRCLVAVGGRIYGWGRSGAWTIDGLLPIHLSAALDPALDGTDPDSAIAYDADQSEAFHATYDPVERIIVWFYCVSGDTVPEHAICYHLDSRQWSTITFRQPIQASGQYRSASEPVRALLADTNGHTWVLKPGRHDGVPIELVNSGSQYTGVITVATTGASATSIPVDQTLPTTPSLVGIVLYDPSTSGTALISANTASGITLAGTGLTAAPSIASELYLGSFSCKIRTKWWKPAGDPKTRPHLVIALYPGSSGGRGIVRVYKDFSATPETWTRSSEDTKPDGVDWTDGNAYATVELDGGSGDGVLFVPMPSSFARVWSAELEIIKPDGDVQVQEMRFEMRERKNAKPARGE